jgi:hypothetical protein
MIVANVINRLPRANDEQLKRLGTAVVAEMDRRRREGSHG